MAAAGSGRIGAAWVGPDPPAKIRPAIPIANTVRNICVSQFSMVDALFIEAVRTTDQLKNKASRSMNGHSARNKIGAPACLLLAQNGPGSYLKFIDAASQSTADKCHSTGFS